MWCRPQRACTRIAGSTGAPCESWAAPGGSHSTGHPRRALPELSEAAETTWCHREESNIKIKIKKIWGNSYVKNQHLWLGKCLCGLFHMNVSQSTSVCLKPCTHQHNTSAVSMVARLKADLPLVQQTQHKPEGGQMISEGVCSLLRSADVWSVNIDVLLHWIFKYYCMLLLIV